MMYVSVTLRNVAVTSRRNVANQRSYVIIIARKEGGAWEHNNKRPKKHLKNEQRSKDAADKKRPNTSGVGKINNYYEDIYIPHNNTD